jgi:AcrR family transcriptional regulator
MNKKPANPGPTLCDMLDIPAARAKMPRKPDSARRETILKAARTVFVRDGFNEAKMVDIAAEAGVAPGTLYLYFASKENLASSIGEEIFLRLLRDFSKVVQKLGNPHGIDILVEWAATIAHEERDLLLLLKPDGHHHNKNEEDGPKEEFRKELSVVLERLMRTEHVRQYEPDVLAEIVLAVVAGIFKTCLCGNPEQTLAMKRASAEALKHMLFEDVAFK